MDCGFQIQGKVYIIYSAAFLTFKVPMGSGKQFVALLFWIG